MIRDSVIRRIERLTGEDATWMRDVSALGRASFARLCGFLAFAGTRRSAPSHLLTLARLGAVMAEDCGPCTRTVARMAIDRGVAPELIGSALTGGSELSGDAGLAYRFGRAIARNGPDVAALGDLIEAEHGRHVRTELTIGAASARVYPAMKRGLGYGSACSLVTLDELR